nr:meiosis-specific topoisomerase [Pseudozyma pruni]
MSSTPPTILQRIDTLITDLSHQLVLQSSLLQPPTPSSSLSSADTETSAADRPTKRARAAPRDSKVKVTPLRIGGFTSDAQVLKVLSLIQVNLRRGTVVTKRDIFYQCLQLFRTQAASDRIIAHIVTLLGCSDRAELNIVASPRGLVAGPLTLTPPSGEKIACAAGRATTIRTEIGDGWSIDLRCASESSTGEHLVLVVEKEAVFKSLVQHQASASSTVQWDRMVMVTGKGYPDHATRTLLRLLASSHSVRVVGLFDADPYGIDIQRQYHLHSRCQIEWIGIDLADFLDRREHLVGLRNDERMKAIRLLRSGVEEDERGRLTEMLLAGYKVEIEAAYDFEREGGRGGLFGYVAHKLRAGVADVV